MCSSRVWHTPCGLPYDAVEAADTMLAVLKAAEAERHE
jgi:hypothetical protein